MKKSLLTLCLFAFCIASNAQYTLTIKDVNFAKGKITGYRGTEKDIIIPDNFGGVAVTSIGECAFCDYQLKKVIIPNSITSIGVAAFEANYLEEITIPNSVTSIGVDAFEENQLESVSIPNSLTSIDVSVFNGNQLTSITIPNSVTSIGEGAFGNNKLASVTIPNSVTSIGESAFESNRLEEITIPNSVTQIGPYAFSYNDLTGFNLPANYESSLYQWTDSNGDTYSSSDRVTDLTVTYTLDEGSVANISITENENIFNFYPNPSGNFIHYDLDLSTLTISNSQGIIVNQFDSNNTEYDVSNLEAGVYFTYAIGTDGTTYASKLIKE